MMITARPEPRRRKRDLLIAATLGLAVIITGTFLWVNSDAATTQLRPWHAGAQEAPAAPTQIPHEVAQVWQLPARGSFSPIVTPYGTVVIASQHAVAGYSTQTATPLWQYERTNSPLCAVASGDTVADPLTSWTGVHGVVTVFEKNGWCSQITLLNPYTGERQFQRTSPLTMPGQLFFGNPYVGWLGDDYAELWRHDLVATIRYGNQVNPVTAEGPHRGCKFLDAAAAANMLATIESCTDDGMLTLAVQWPTPSDAPGDHDWDTDKFEARSTISLVTDAARLLAVTADQIAVLVAQPTPAVVVYSADGTEVSRTPTSIPASAITESQRLGPTPSIDFDHRRYVLIDNYVAASSRTSVTVADPEHPEQAGDTAEDFSTGPSVAEHITVAGIVPALGLPTMISADAVVPVAQGWQAYDAALTQPGALLPIARETTAHRIDLHAVGDMVIETSAAGAVGYRAVQSPG